MFILFLSSNSNKTLNNLLDEKKMNLIELIPLYKNENEL